MRGMRLAKARKEGGRINFRVGFNMKTIITYGTFDLFHIGHLNILRHASELGDRLIVAVSTDEFNAVKGKTTSIPYEDRAEIIRAIRYVDEVIPETCWNQKRQDIIAHGVSCFVMGNDWAGKFDDLTDICKVVYLPRTEEISTTQLKSSISHPRDKEYETRRIRLSSVHHAGGQGRQSQFDAAGRSW